MNRMADKASIKVLVHGRVQGVYFRDFTCRRAAEYDLSGYVKNLSDGRSVEVYAEGEKASLEKLVSHLKVGPPGAVVEEITASYGDYTGTYNGFTIKH
jgi:acylphosphatase